MADLTWDLAQWAEENFGSCDLYDLRRTRRAVQVAQQMAEHPDGSGPAQMERWSDLKALYRLFDADDVTFTALATPHWQRTRSLEQQPLSGAYQLPVRATKKHPARTARLHVRFARVTLRCPKRQTKYQRSIGFTELTQWVVEVREIRPPQGVEPLHWVLWTSLPIARFDDAWRVIEYYEQRWLIEEFHQAIKTGCRLEARQYLQAHRLEAVAGITCVLALRLLQLKTIATTHPDLPAARVVPKIWLKMLSALRNRKLITVRDFFRHLAGLGGFLMRKGDGEPGWITLWRGLDKLILAVRGFVALQQKCG